MALRQPQPQPFFCRAGRWAGHWQDAGRWNTVIAYLSARLYPSTGCQDMQTRQPRMAGNKFGKKREHKTKAKQMLCVITGPEAGAGQLSSRTIHPGPERGPGPNRSISQ